MGPIVRCLVAVLFGVSAIACSGMEEQPMRRPPPTGGDEVPDVEQGLCSTPIRAVVDVAGQVVLSGTFEQVEAIQDECIGASRGMIFELEVPQDGTVEIGAWTSFQASLSVVDGCGEPSRAGACLSDLPKHKSFAAVSRGEPVYLSLAGAANAQGPYEIRVDFHEARKVDEACSPAFRCETGAFCSGDSHGVCVKTLEVTNPSLTSGGPTGDELVLAFDASGRHSYLIAYELEITDAGGESTLIERDLIVHHFDFITLDDKELLQIRQVLFGALDGIGEPKAARLRVSNGGWGEWQELDVRTSPVRNIGESCDPAYLLDRCDPQSACVASEAGNATCLPLGEVKQTLCQTAQEVRLGEQYSLESSGRGLWEFPAACDSELTLGRSFAEQTRKISIDEAGILGLSNDSGFETVFMVLDCAERENPVVACFGGGGRTLSDLTAGDYLIVLKSTTDLLPVDPVFHFSVHTRPTF